MAFRIDESVIRGEIDNREKGRVRGQIWVHGRAEPVVLDLKGNAHPDLAGCLLRFENPRPTTAHPHLESLAPLQAGVIGDLTASRKVRVFDVPVTEAYAMSKRGEKPPEHLANCLYLEWFSQANGRVVIESTAYRLELSPPAWRLSPEEERQRAEDAANGFAAFMDGLTQALDAQRFDHPGDRPMDEFDWEKSFRESDALTDKAMELWEKHGEDPDFDEILAREMGWNRGRDAECDDPTDDEEVAGWNLEEFGPDAAEAEAEPREPNPATEGIDWVRDDDGDVAHPLEIRVREAAIRLMDWGEDNGLLDEPGNPDVHEMAFKLQMCGAKCAGALGDVPYGEVFEPGFVVAGLKRALKLLHDALGAAERAGGQNPVTAAELAPWLEEMHGIRAEILALMQRFRGRA